MSASGSCSRGYLLTRSTTWLLTSAGNQRVRSRQSARSPTWAGAADWTLTDPAGRPAAGLRVAQLADEPGDEVGVGELEDQAVGDPPVIARAIGP